MTVSRRGHPHHAHAAGVRGGPVVIDGPGEYEIAGVQVFGVPGNLPAAGGDPPEASRNTAFLLEAEGLRVAHLGGGSSPPAGGDAGPFGNAAVLIVAIGGGDPETAGRAVRDLEPAVAIPVGYAGADGEAALAAFLGACGRTAEEPQPRYGVPARGPGDQARAVLLESRGAA